MLKIKKIKKWNKENKNMEEPTGRRRRKKKKETKMKTGNGKAIKKRKNEWSKRHQNDEWK